jgi:2-desacetyl-2-hydroxyethyl bacteriochlorophyllide A dehydrogenase
MKRRAQSTPEHEQPGMDSAPSPEFLGERRGSERLTGLGHRKGGLRATAALMLDRADASVGEALSHTARAFWLEAAGRGAIREELLPALDGDAVRVEARYSAISRGTESLVWQGRVPPSEQQRMRCPHQSGEFSFPLKYGYSSVGRVVDGSATWLGRSVFCLFPHQTSYVVAPAAVVPLPDGVPEARAVLAANLETAVNAVWDARPLLGDRVSVIGAGVVGSLSAYLVRRMCAVEVELVDLRPERASVARAFGAEFAAPKAARAERDLVFHASGSAAGLQTALGLVAAEGSVIELSWFGDRNVTLPLGEHFHAGRLTLRSSQVGRLSPNARPRFTHRSRLELALELCRDPALDALFDGETSFEHLPAEMPRLLDEARGGLCHRVSYG